MNSSKERFFNAEMKLLVNVLLRDADKVSDFLKEHRLDWRLFLQLVDYHRVNPHVALFLSKNKGILPDKIEKELIDKGAIIKVKNLAIVAELSRLHQLFAQHNIEVLCIKGPMQSRQIYNDAFLRHYKDLDLLVKSNNIMDVEKLLFEAGYFRRTPNFDLTPKQHQYILKRVHDFEYVNRKKILALELHWRLFSNSKYFPLSFQDIYTSREQISIGGQTLSTFSLPVNLLYMSAHGMQHQFFRLFWLYDFYSALLKSSVEMFRETLSLAKKLQMEKMFLSSVKLVDEVFETKFSKLEKSNSLVKNSLRSLSSVDFFDHDRQMKKFAMVKHNMNLRNNLGYKLKCFKLLSPHYYDFEKVKLPDALFFLYYILRPVFWMAEKLFGGRKNSSKGIA